MKFSVSGCMLGAIVYCVELSWNPAHMTFAQVHFPVGEHIRQDIQHFARIIKLPWSVTSCSNYFRHEIHMCFRGYSRFHYAKIHMFVNTNLVKDKIVLLLHWFSRVHTSKHVTFSLILYWYSLKFHDSKVDLFSYLSLSPENKSVQSIVCQLMMQMEVNWKSH